MNPAFATTLGALVSHWRRHPVQLATLMIGLALATALWSGVQALNTAARASYDDAAERLTSPIAGARLIEGRAGRPLPLALYGKLRRAGWPVSPMIRVPVRVNAVTVTVLGLDPISLPAPNSDRAEAETRNMAFMAPPYRGLVHPDTLTRLGLNPGDRPVAGRAAETETDKTRLPPLHPSPDVRRGTIMMDMAPASLVMARPDRLSALILMGDATPDLPEDTRIVAPDRAADLSRLTESFHLNLTAFGLLAFLVGLFIVHQAVGLAYEQRRATIAVIRRIGVSRRLVSLCLLAEMTTLALISGAAGMILGGLIARALLPDLAASLEGLYGARLADSLTLPLGWWLGGLAMSLGGAWLAAMGHVLALRGGILKRGRVPLQSGGGQPAPGAGGPGRWQTLAGFAALLALVALYPAAHGLPASFAMMASLLLAAALLMPLLLDGLLRALALVARGPVGQWLMADSRARLNGLSLALMALLLALAVNIGVSTMVQSFRATFTGFLDERLFADLYVRAPDGATADRMAGFVTRRFDRASVLANVQAETRLDGAPITVAGVDESPFWHTHWTLLNAVADPWPRLQQGDGLLVSEQLARRRGLSPGDRMTIPARRGVLNGTVVGIYADYGNPRGAVRVATRRLIRHFPDADRTRLGIVTDQPDMIADALRQTFRPGGEAVLDQAGLKAYSLDIFDRTFMVTTALKTLTLLVAGIALFTSLLTLSSMAIPALAPLWAMGLTRRRLALLDGARTVFLATLVGVLALPLGLMVAHILLARINVAAFGWRIPMESLPADWLGLMALALPVAALAALWPAISLVRQGPMRWLKGLQQDG
ncbi:FtsX-like permease family protein [Yunchengibacter salinarum]|uniref:FtsX-like permease family protein n=1 Tax=Yunchengibacter salinarum TaxID=3133399 RepID=UPI0035B65CF7